MNELISCLKCGKCCKSLIEEHHGIYQGMLLFPDEAKKLKKIGKQKGIEVKIKPKDGVSKNGSYKPDNIISYQFEDEVCPFFDEKSTSCSIYNDRPIVCRAYPLTLCYNYLMVSGDCSWIKQRTPNSSNCISSPNATEEIMWVNLVKDRIQHYLFSREVHLLWIFDLRTKRWISSKIK